MAAVNGLLQVWSTSLSRSESCWNDGTCESRSKERNTCVPRLCGPSASPHLLKRSLLQAMRLTGHIAWWCHELLVGSRELTGSASERGLLGFTLCERAAMFASNRFWKPLSESLGEQWDEPADKQWNLRLGRFLIPFADADEVKVDRSSDCPKERCPSSRMLAESEGPGRERCLKDDAFAVAFEPDVEVANEQNRRRAKHREPELLDVGGLGVVAIARRDDSSTPQSEVRCGLEA
jgi:hypothetical protein